MSQTFETQFGGRTLTIETGKLARLAASLEARGYKQERVSRFLMRCVFTMFAEDVRLLPDEPFRHLVDDIALPNPEEFVPAAEELCRRAPYSSLTRLHAR